MANKLTLLDARAKLIPLGINLRAKNEAGEYRVNFRNGLEATAYYTDCLEDAVKTGEDMAVRKLEALVEALKEALSICWDNADDVGPDEQYHAWEKVRAALALAEAR